MGNQVHEYISEGLNPSNRRTFHTAVDKIEFVREGDEMHMRMYHHLGREHFLMNRLGEIRNLILPADNAQLRIWIVALAAAAGEKIVSSSNEDSTVFRLSSPPTHK